MVSNFFEAGGFGGSDGGPRQLIATFRGYDKWYNTLRGSRRVYDTVASCLITTPCSFIGKISGIGTDASMASHIDNVVARHYVMVCGPGEPGSKEAGPRVNVGVNCCLAFFGFRGFCRFESLLQNGF